MTARDEELARKARFDYYGEIDENSADTPEGKEAIRRAHITAYHYEEYKAGLL